jgi:hypothetical protein
MRDNTMNKASIEQEAAYAIRADVVSSRDNITRL